MNKNSYILQAFLETPWAILPNKLASLQEIVERHAAGEKLSAEEIEVPLKTASLSAFHPYPMLAPYVRFRPKADIRHSTHRPVEDHC